MLRRLHQEAKNSNTYPITPILKLEPEQDDLFRWTCIIVGPEGTPYSGGEFQVSIEIPPNYPLEPPICKFITKVCHPNVHFRDGSICLDVLKSEWSPAWTLHSLIIAIHVLLSYPDVSSPYNCDCANLIRCNDERGYRSLARFYTNAFAKR